MRLQQVFQTDTPEKLCPNAVGNTVDDLSTIL
jgi:hypothetical protein